MFRSSNGLKSLSMFLALSSHIQHSSSTQSYSMAPTSYSCSSSSAIFHHERPNLESIRGLVISVNQYLLEFLANAETRNSVRLSCSSQLKIQKQEFFEFSEHSVLSNLYWGLDNIETAIQAKWPEEKTSRLKNSEQMLQVPALLDEHGFTAGIPNRYLVCCSYFYLSVIRKLQRDEWQVALHFLQALLVSPRLVQTELAPVLCKNLFPLCILFQMQDSSSRNLESAPLMDFGEESESIRQMARRYKDWLMYYQVMLYGETPRWHNGGIDISSPDYEKQYSSHAISISTSTEAPDSIEHGHSSLTYCKEKKMQFEKVYPIGPQEDINGYVEDKAMASKDIPKFQDYRRSPEHFDQVHSRELARNSNIKCLQDMLKESLSDTPTSGDSPYDDSTEADDIEAYMNSSTSLMGTTRMKADDPQQEIFYQKLWAPCSTSELECISISLAQAPQHALHKEADKVNNVEDWSHNLWNCYVEDWSTQRTSEPHEFHLFDHIAAASLQNCRFPQICDKGSAARIKTNSCSQKTYNEICLGSRKDSQNELSEITEEVNAKLCFSEELGKSDKDYTIEVTTICEMLRNSKGVKYAMLKDIILDQLLTALSTSKEEAVIRASVSILTAIISAKESVIEDIKKKGIQLCDLASALKRNVYEAAILIFLINPSPTEIKTLELLPTLVEVVCTSNSYKGKQTSLVLTPPAAALMIIEVLVTAFDYATNSKHLEVINSPRVLCGLLDVARNNNLEEFPSLATVLVKCMQFDGQCRKYISQHTPVAPFIALLQSDSMSAKLIALEFFHEILCMPRSSANSLLQQIRKEGSSNLLHILLLCVQQLQPEYQLLAANLLLQLETLENSTDKSIFREEAVQVLLKSLASEESSAAQLLSASILSNLGGTYAWTGEPYTVAWLLKKAGLTSLYHRNMIKNFNWLDESLQDKRTDSWCSKVARSIINIGNPVFHALERGLKSKIKRVSRDSLTTVAWLGYEITKSPNSLRYSACEILLNGIEQYLHPGLEIEERFLACLCIYNYASGKGMQKLIHFSEGVRESLRRFSNVTWMAEELHRVANYFLPNNSRISCVHTQILEAGHSSSGAVNALIYYKGLLYSGHLDGSIKAWDIKRQSATLVWDMKEHKKAVTCFSIFEPGESLLSGSADKTIRVWQMVQKKLECVEVIATKEPIQKLDTCGQMIFFITEGRAIKVLDSSRTVKYRCKGKKVKCMEVAQGKIYIGCVDSSIQELAIASSREREIKAPAKSWRMLSRPINSISMYKDWLYSASSVVEASNIKEWRRHCEPQTAIVGEKGTSVLAMEVVEDFVYLNCSSSTSIIQIWLRGTQQRVGRLSAGSKITSLLTANDTIICGTETGLIKGWIPL